MMIETIIPALLNSLVDNCVWQDVTPDDLPRNADNTFKPFVVWSLMGGQDAEFVDQTMPEFSHARMQLHAVGGSSIASAQLIRDARDRLLASGYTVGVYGSPVGTYDPARKLHGRFQQFSIWFPAN